MDLKSQISKKDLHSAVVEELVCEFLVGVVESRVGQCNGTAVVSLAQLDGPVQTLHQEKNRADLQWRVKPVAVAVDM